MRKRRVVGKIYRMKYSRRGNKDRNIHKTEWKEVGKFGWFMSKTYTATPPSREDEPVGTKTISGCDLDNMTYHQTTSFRLIYQCRSTTVCDGDEDDGRFLADEDLGRWGVTSCILVGGCRVRFLMRRPYCTLDRPRFGLRSTIYIPSLYILYPEKRWRKYSKGMSVSEQTGWIRSRFWMTAIFLRNNTS